MNAHVVRAVSEGQRFAADLNLEVVTCPSCRIVFAIPASLASSARAYPGGQAEGGWTICCPMGHEWHYTGKSVEEKLREERQRVQATRDLLEYEQRRHAATRGHLTRQKKRLAAGVCPCCNRTFQQLARHMQTKHPKFVVDAKPIGEADSPNPARQERVQPLLAFLGDGERTYTEIREHLGITDGHASILTHRLVKSGAIVRVRRGVYRTAAA